MLALLSALHGAAGALPPARRALPSPALRRAGRRWLERAVIARERGRPGDVTVAIGFRNRPVHRLANALASLRAQTYPAALVRPVVVDWGSDPGHAGAAAAVCAEHGAELVRVDGPTVWSRGRCLNVALRRAGTKFVLASDADVVFSETYVEDAVALLDAEPLAVAGAPMLDLPEESVAAFADGLPDLGVWRARCDARYGLAVHPSIGLTWTAVLRAIRGYDELYEVWGAEDDDLARRLRFLGLDPGPVDPRSFHLHQWHPKADRGRDGENEAAVERNRAHLARAHTIRRNGRGWGAIGG